MITTTTDLPPAIQLSFNGKLLSVRQPNLIHNLFGMQTVKPRNSGDIHRFRRYAKLATAMVPLGNTGVTPPGQQLSAVNIDARVQFYGTWLEINEQVTLTSQDRPLNQAANLLGIALRETEDELTRNMLMATASFINATGGTNGDNPTEVTRADVDNVVRTLLSADAKTLADDIEGADKFGTAPVRHAFMGMCSTELSGSLDGVNGFTHVSQYPSQMNIARSEWGAIGNVRFFLSSKGAVRANSSVLGANVYPIFITGMEAYGLVKQDGYTANFIYRPSIYSGPMALNSTAAFKMAYASRILNDAWILSLNVTL